jgi:LuxR family transcriptional regulator, maltose regulon positive regulatory protein
MGQSEGSSAVAGRVAGLGAQGVVARTALWERLGGAARVTVVSAPPGSGKTVLLRSWISEAGLGRSAAWVPVGREERDPQQFWLSVLGALRATAPGSGLVRELTPAPELDGWAITERLLKDLAPLAEPVWLVLDDVHELGSDEARRQLELLVMRGPDELRLVLVTRHDARLGLHRLRLEGELTEIRGGDLRFTLGEARALFEAAEVELSDPALALLHERTEGWAAGLRLAALALAGHPDPERFGAEFSGSERTVAEYLLAEVLERQSEEVRRLLVHTSVLERVSGPLADALTEGSGGERILQDMEEANAFVVSLDSARSWFRYHHLFADLLQLELRRTEPGQVAVLHAAAAEWFAEHEFSVEALRHAQAARDWGLAARLLSDHWLGIYLGGQGPIVAELLARFPGEAVTASPELAALRVVGHLLRGSLEEAARQLAAAAGGLASVRGDRRGRVQVLLSVLRLFLARRLADYPVVSEEAQRLLALPVATDAARRGLGEDVRAAALISLSFAEIWVLRFEDSERHLERGVTLARRIGLPWLEFHGLTHWAHGMLLARPDALQSARIRQAIELAERHGWGEETLAGVSYTGLGIVMLYQGRLADAELWLERAERTLRPEVEPVAGVSLRYARAVLEMARGRYQHALDAFQAAEDLAATLVTPHSSVTSMRSSMLHALVRLGHADRAEAALARLDEHERESAEMRTAVAALRLARGDPQAAADALAPVLDGSFPGAHGLQMMTALLVEARARDALGDQAAVGRALEGALDLAEPDGIVLPFLLDPAPALLERHRRSGTAHHALISEILDLLTGKSSAPAPAGPQPPLEPLSKSEIRVLRYLPTNLSAPEIANELYVSPNTVKTHMHHLYTKLGTHRRSEAVARARALGLLAPAARHRWLRAGRTCGPFRACRAGLRAGENRPAASRFPWGCWRSCLARSAAPSSPRQCR